MQNLDLTPSTAAQRDTAAEDAHRAIRSVLLQPLLRRPDATTLLDRIARGDELRIEVVLFDRVYGIFLIGSTRETVATGTLPPEGEALDMLDACGLAVVSALNAESPDRRREVGALRMAAAQNTQANAVVCMLRVNAATETLVMRIGLGTPPAFVTQRCVELPPESWLRPTLQ